MAARSFCVSIPAPLSPAVIGRLLGAVRADVPSASAGLVFVSGALTQDVALVAEQVRSAWRGIPACVVPAAGVLSERGEVEGASAVSGILWSGGRATPFASEEGARDLPELLVAANGGARRSATALLFARASVSASVSLSTGSPDITLFGAGTVGGGALAVTDTGGILTGDATGLLLHGLATPLVDSSPACRLVTAFQPVDEVSDGMILRIGGEPALDALAALGDAARGRQAAAVTDPVDAGHDGGPSKGPPYPSGHDGGPSKGPPYPSGHDGGPSKGPPFPSGHGGDPAPKAGARAALPAPVVFLALAGATSDDRYVVRPVRGVDPTRRGLLVGNEIKPGMRVAFAVRDAAAARSGLEASARTLSQKALGSAPRFALHLTCAGRGQGLYGAPDVEARILRQRFGDLPIAGMHSAFEIAPWAAGEARVALYTGVLALFRSPS